VIRNGWVLIIALAHAWAQRKAGRPRRADVVICTRYTLDAIVALRFRYAADRPLRLAATLLRMLSPRPLRAYYLDVDADVAFARRAEQFGLPELERLTALYRQECEPNDVVSLDGTAPREMLCEKIALDVWSAVVGR
jgi:thymidylate kinase